MTTPFYNGIAQKDIWIRGQKSKSPAFYRDINMMLGLCTADMKAIRSLLPNEKYKPLSMWPGRGLVGISCFEYKDTDVGPYNEVALSIGIKDVINPQRFSLIRANYSKKYHSHILQLPVTTEIALHGGLDYFNFPKYLANIQFREDESKRYCEVFDKKTNELIYSFSGKQIPTKTQKSNKSIFYSYPIMREQMLRATFWMNMIEKGETSNKDCFQVTLGKHSKSQLLSTLKLGRVMRYLSIPRCEGILFEPVVV